MDINNFDYCHSIYLILANKWVLLIPLTPLDPKTQRESHLFTQGYSLLEADPGVISTWHQA